MEKIKMTMKRILTMLMLACIVLVPSCKSGGKKAGEKIQNGEKTLTELVQDVTEAPKMGIWFVNNLHSKYIPTIKTEYIKHNESRQNIWISTYFPSTLNFSVRIWGKYPHMEDNQSNYELHLKSNNQEEIIVYGSANTSGEDPSFNGKDSKQIFTYLSTATSPVTFTFVGVPKNMTFEIPIEGFKEVCKCWYNALKEEGYDRCLK